MKSVLISMPWPTLHYPSIQIGLLKAAAAGQSISVDTRSFYIDFAQLIVEATAAESEPLTTADYASVADSGWQVALGDWIFAVEPYRSNTDDSDAAYEQFAQIGGFFAKAKRMRALAPQFLERCADDITATGATVVGFTSTFNQNIPSLALAMMLKRRNPEICIVFGGANCDEPMGPALHRSFPASIMSYRVKVRKRFRHCSKRSHRASGPKRFLVSRIAKAAVQSPYPASRVGRSPWTTFQRPIIVNILGASNAVRSDRSSTVRYPY